MQNRGELGFGGAIFFVSGEFESHNWFDKDVDNSNFSFKSFFLKHAFGGAIFAGQSWFVLRVVDPVTGVESAFDFAHAGVSVSFNTEFYLNIISSIKPCFSSSSL